MQIFYGNAKNISCSMPGCSFGTSPFLTEHSQGARTPRSRDPARKYPQAAGKAHLGRVVLGGSDEHGHVPGGLDVVDLLGVLLDIRQLLP